MIDHVPTGPIGSIIPENVTQRGPKGQIDRVHLIFHVLHHQHKAPLVLGVGIHKKGPIQEGLPLIDQRTERKKIGQHTNRAQEVRLRDGRRLASATTESTQIKAQPAAAR